MSTSKSKLTVLKFSDHLQHGEFCKLPALFAPEGAKWHVLGDLRYDPHAFDHDPAELATRGQKLVDQFDVWNLTIRNIIADGDRAAFEGEVKAHRKGREPYENRFMMFFKLDEEGRMLEIRELRDYAAMQRYFGNPSFPEPKPDDG